MSGDLLDPVPATRSFALGKNVFFSFLILYLKALAVSSDDTDEESGPPMDGMAYLKQVIKVCTVSAEFQIRELLAARRTQPSNNCHRPKFL